MSKQLSNKMKSLLMERRKFLSGAAALGAGAGLSASSVISNAAAAERSDIAWRDRDLRFIGTEETYSTDELITQIAINDDHVEYLKSLGLSEIGSGRIATMDDAGLNVQILSVHTPGVQNVPGWEGIDFAYRLNKTIADGPMARWSTIRDGSRHLQLCRCRTRMHQRTNWNALFGKMVLWEL